MKNITASGFYRGLIFAQKRLQDHEEEINKLNVYPVPDGDTGTNMRLTLAQAIKEMETAGCNSIGEMAAGLALGALMGARGNSGVILSQLLRGLAQELAGSADVDAKGLARACEAAVNTAYKAVLKPVEGTMLTVARAGAQAITNTSQRTSDLQAILEEAISAAKEALSRTPTMLPVLARAGVVDAGGMGIVVLLEGFLAGLLAQHAPEATSAARKHPLPEEVTLAPPEYLYCTEFLLKGPSIPVQKLQTDLLALGESVLVVGTSHIARIHIHTNMPWKVMELAGSYGTMHDIKIDNMSDQQRSMAGKPGEIPAPDNNKPAYIIAVASGQGLEEAFRSLGADYVVPGGRTMNPSTEELLRAIQSSNGSRIYVLPNNENVLSTAEQAKQLASQEVIIIPSVNIPQGLQAITAFNPQLSPEENMNRMLEAMNRGTIAEVTYATKNSTITGWEIKKGEIIGLVNGSLVTKGNDPHEVALYLIKQALTGGELLTIVYGEDVAAEEAEQLLQEVKQGFPSLEVEMIAGGQPLYYYIMWVE